MTQDLAVKLPDELIPLNDLAESGHCSLVNSKVSVVQQECQQISPTAEVIPEQYIKALHEHQPFLPRCDNTGTGHRQSVAEEARVRITA